MTTRDFVQACRDAMICADVILPGRLVIRRKPTVRDIARQVAEESGISFAEIMSRSRVWRFSHPRQEAMRRAHCAGFSLNQIGNLWGYDHTTVMHGIKSATHRMEEIGGNK